MSTSTPPAPAATALPDLGNTRIAFAAKSDHELWKAYWLFRIIGTSWLTTLGSTCSRIALALHLPVKGLIKATIFKQFCGGETVEECLHTATKLAQSGVGSILDHSVEGQDDEDELDATVTEVLRTVAVNKTRTDLPYCVFKPTGISRTELLRIVSSGRALTAAEQVEWQRVEQRMERLCRAAHDADARLLVDAEESWLQPAIDGLVQEMMERYNGKKAVVFNTVQLYRHDRLAFLRESHAQAVAKGYYLGMKLVRGAYMEKERERAEEQGYPSPIHANKADADRDYDAALQYCVDHLDRIAVCVGTHNEQSTLLMAQLMQARGLPHQDDRIWYGQLLGMSDHISFNMSSAGYNVCKYLPYGPVRKVLPYLIRRAEENTSVKGQTGREIRLIGAERKRRKGQA